MGLRTPVTDYVINVPLHPGQLEVATDPARFKVLASGRRWGKSRLAVYLCFAAAAQGGRVWWVAPTYGISRIGWRGCKALAKKIPEINIKEGEKLLEFPGGGSIMVKSADNPDSLRGEGLDFLALDEAAFVREEAWTEALRPTLSIAQGRALIISTPRGRNWFWRAFMQGQATAQARLNPSEYAARSDAENDWMSWSFPSSTNPYYPAGEVEAAAATMPDASFRQEYLAEFLEDSGTVFRHIEDAKIDASPEYLPYHRYVMGVDWGRYNDFTVCAVVDIDDRRLVAIDRFNEIGWDVQRARVKSMADHWHVEFIEAESNSIGEPNIEGLRTMGLSVVAFNTTAQSKGQLIGALQLAFEQWYEPLSALRLTDGIEHLDTVVGELQAFEMKRLPSGTWRYEAPSGMHDDCVMALALALWAANQSMFGGIWA